MFVERLLLSILFVNNLHMESNKILQADILDILFEDRNKAYGAYELRKSYNKRLIKSIAVTGVVIGLLFVGGMVSGRGNGKKAVLPQATEVDLAAVKDPTPPTPPPPAPPKPVVQVKQLIFTPPVIVPNDKADQPPPTQEDIETAKIGTENKAGVDDIGAPAPPAVSDAGGKGIIEAPKKNEEPEIFETVEIESEFPGGMPAWARFLNKTLRYPDAAQDAGIQGVVMVKFIVDEKGNVSDVEAISGPEGGGLREEAIRTIKKSGTWTPAVQNGRHVKSYKRQPIVFKISE